MFDLTFSESEFTLTLDNQVKTLLRRASSLWKHFPLKAQKCIFCIYIYIYIYIYVYSVLCDMVLMNCPTFSFTGSMQCVSPRKVYQEKILSFVFSSPKISWHRPFKAATFQQHILIDKVSNSFKNALPIYGWCFAVNPTVARACSLWAKYANLTFQEVTSGTPDLEIRFESGIGLNKYHS